MSDMKLALIMLGVPLLIVGSALMQSGHRLYGALPLAAGVVAVAWGSLAAKK
jgi:hypothetical protein